ncbi:Serine/threonine-protein kinase SSN3 [Tolypocladium capitatum]|uniref:Serine/threonine-protein kinase SSN3 n=1 Tax=Tolypocladium capitatum TaxID=45235 RepID=A0A2K3QL06_9HYPO|nr:Serine/threonine-protein kinase SSN3 [Tolypocladium capitatum]
MPLRLRHGVPNSASSGLSSPASHQRSSENGDRSPGLQSRARGMDRYRIVGFISSGTYGRVYKAISRTGPPGHNHATTAASSSSQASDPASASSSASASASASASVLASASASGPGGAEVAIKKFKPDKEGEQVSYTGISQSAIREMSLCSELRHANVIRLVEIILEDKCIYMVFDYAEHDLLQIIHHHTQQPRHPIPPATVKSIMFQLLNGCQYLHTNWVLHRDLKPANIMVTSGGEVKIGDLGLARRFDKPLHSLFSGDKVVVTIWYRAPELILGSYHYTPAIDMWAVGCIMAELLSLRPIFKGEEAKMDSKKTVPFQRNQMQKIVDIMGLPNRDRWPLLTAMPEYGQLSSLQPPHTHGHTHHHHHHHHHSSSSSSRGGGSNLEKWYYNTISNAATSSSSSPPLTSLGPEGFKLLAGLLEYDPVKRLTAAQALQSSFFSTGDRVTANAFEGLKVEYPHRRVSQDDNDIRTSSLPGSKRSGLPDDSLLRPAKRVKE